jgi:hypothetical protein
MPPSARPWEPEFIRLWQVGATQAQIAAALGVPVGTIKSRAHAVAAQGKIQARPRGGLVPVPPTEVHPGTPRHTIKKTYVVDTLYVDLIERYARTEGLELKDVVNLALHEFFEQRHYLPQEGP